MRPLIVSVSAYYLICMTIGAISSALSGLWLGFWSPGHFMALMGIMIFVYIIARYYLVIDDR